MLKPFFDAFGGSATAATILVAGIGLAGVLGGALASYLTSHQTAYVNAITTERMKWVNTLRTNIAQVVALMFAVKSFDGDDDYPRDAFIKDLREANVLANTVTLQLNPRSLVDRNIILILFAIQECGTAVAWRESLDAMANALGEHAQWLLKMEWERVKVEARSPLGKWRHRKSYQRIVDEYEQFARRGNGLPQARHLTRHARLPEYLRS
ncbi:hypothetical protein M9979_02665 [Sphingomonas sp. RP10(2022)]|uniref:DUF4760 domain-containing protein n=1 Tax=Sphingomonas liriopis TaxID=2949094 RepID=A0A9X2KSG9_9SPHN|nr:hypothetical protein [Sphingomonas liriopis]MCP3733783.1 hypothetical protein [Sphingomonas liriopis]